MSVLHVAILTRCQSSPIYCLLVHLRCVVIAQSFICLLDLVVVVVAAVAVVAAAVAVSIH